MFRKNKVNRIGKEVKTGVKINEWGVNLIGLIYESKKKLQILMYFLFIEQELLLSKKTIKNLTGGYSISFHLIYFYVFL